MTASGSRRWNSRRASASREIQLARVPRLNDDGERAHDRKAVGRWTEAFYGHDKRYVWTEPPVSERGKRADA
jgi:hypothetical protein